MKQSRVFGKHNASRLRLHGGGTVVTGPEGWPLRTTVDSAELQSIAPADLFLRLCRHLRG